MMLKTFAVLFFVAICTALPFDENKDVGDIQSPVDIQPPVDIQLPVNIQPLVDPQAEVKEDEADLKTDSSFWGGYNHGYYRYPIQRRSFTYPVYRPSIYYYQTYPTYWNAYW